MFVIVSGSNRPGNVSSRLAGLVQRGLEELGREARILDLLELPDGLFRPESYEGPPEAFTPFQDAVLRASGIVTVVPEYNGSFPGVLKYFIDMLRFPDSLVGKPAAFVGLSAGTGGGVRAVEQLEMVFQYRNAHLYGRRLFLRNAHGLLGAGDELLDAELAARLERLLRGFAAFADAVSASAGAQ